MDVQQPVQGTGVGVGSEVAAGDGVGVGEGVEAGVGVGVELLTVNVTVLERVFKFAVSHASA